VEWLKVSALSSNPSTAKKKKEKINPFVVHLHRLVEGYFKNPTECLSFRQLVENGMEREVSF
jgi:hypothetical protein